MTITSSIPTKGKIKHNENSSSDISSSSENSSSESSNVSSSISSSSSSQDSSSSSSEISSSSNSSSEEPPEAEDGSVVYYGIPTSEIIIDVHILNPKQYEILSFTLNAYKYQSYQFQDGSDSENLYLKLFLPQASGYASYSIDAIKYIDGTITKDVNMSEASKTVKVGVTYETIPTANLESETIGYDGYSSSIYLSDLSNLVVDGGFESTIYNSYSTKVASKVLALGDNDISFSDLEMDSSYKIKLTASCDILDGNGLTKLVIYEGSFKTKQGLSIETLTPTKTDVSYSINSKIQDLVVDSVSIIDSNGDKVAAGVGKTGTITGLLTNATYKLKVGYTYGTHSGFVSQDFTTLSNTAPSFSFKNVTPSKTAVSFGYAFVDSDSIGKIDSISINDGGSTLAKAVVTNPDGNSFVELQSNHEYKLQCAYSYDLGDGGGRTSKSFDYTFRTGAKIAPVVVIQNVDAGQESATFEVATTDDDAICSIESITLNKDGAVNKTASDTTVRTFTGLLSNNAYEIDIKYSYDLNDGTGKVTKTATKSFNTLSKAIPAVLINDVTPTQTSASFSISKTDTDKVLSVKSVGLFKGDTQVEIADSTDITSFTGLLSNTTYTIKVAYTYNLNDGKGIVSDISSESFTTVAKTAPTISFENLTKGETSISGDVTVNDVDSIISLGDVELDNNGTSVGTTSSTTFSFSSLSAYTQYSLKVPYSYDLNDGTGVHKDTLAKDIKTDPHFALTATTIINTSAVSEGDTIVLQATLDNPQKATATSVEVNGKTYAVSTASTTSKIRVEIVDEGQFKGGDTELKINSISLSLDSESYEVSSDANNKGNIFVNGKITFKKASFARKLEDGTYQESGWFLKSEQMYLYLTFNNPTGYTIDSVTYDSATTTPTAVTSAQIVDVDHVAIAYEGTIYNNQQSKGIYGVTYSNQYVSAKTLANIEMARAYRCISDDVKNVTLASDLLNCDDGYYYKLQNDIDLKGTEWAGGELDGVFDGDNHTISNMSVVATFADTNKNFGLFQKAQGAIFDTTVKDGLYMVTMTNSGSSNYTVRYGAIAGTSDWEWLSINCAKAEDCSFEMTTASGYSALIGGIVGDGSYSSINSCSSSGSINGCDWVGGIVGQAYYSTISSCVSSCSVSGENSVGGVVGYLFSSSLSSCASSSSINTSSNGGGIAGQSCSSFVSLSTYSGSLFGGNTLGGIVGYQSDGSVSYCASFGSINGGENGYNFGGIVGYQGNGSVSSSFSSTSIVCKGYNAGGIVGCSNGSSISLCVSSGSISCSSNRCGGIAGELNGVATLSSCLAINCPTTSLYGIIGMKNSNSTISSSYYSPSGLNSDYGIKIEDNSLLTAEWFKKTLGLDSTVWDLTNVDVPNGKLPTLKGLPTA
jgi:hypothetical protein